LTIWVTRRSTATLASATASGRDTPYNRPSRSNIPSSAANTASSTVSPRPIVTQPAGVRATGPATGKSSTVDSVRSTRSIGHSIAVPLTSPSPWAACPSPTESNAPSTGIGSHSVLPATSSRQSRLPPCGRGGIVECRPGSAGGIPITPGNGRSATVCPCWLRPVPATGSSVQRCTADPVSPYRALNAVGRALA
jgi:hypothetical protein